MNPQTILITLLVILCLNYLLDKVMDFLNLSRLSPNLPTELSEFYDEEEYARSQTYLRTRMRFGFLSSTFSFVLILVVVLSGAFGMLDEWLRVSISSPAWLACAFFGILFLANGLISLPFSLYSTFVIEERFGFNKTTPKTFLLDKLKGYVLAVVLGGALLHLLVWMVNLLQQDFWLWFWLAMSVLMLGIQFLYAAFLLPLFNKLTPLADGELRTEIEAYAAKVSFPLCNIMVMNGSKRSTKANAFFSGFGATKRIVLYDTLIEQMTTSELVAVLAHEVGHYKRRHIQQGMVISVLNTGLMLFILSLFVFEPAMSIALGATQPGLHLGLIAFTMLYAPISLLFSLFLNALSRRNEYQADDYARTTYDGEALRNALSKLHVKTLSNLHPHPAYVFTYFGHPTLLQRLAALRKGESYR